ncbi:MAG: hypothetical protein HW405_399 [Candidatus Berkelbacteria bacterium]|nr:hypothetical protein [Candidatus Berkelbacteria bacterium]
MEEQSRAPYFPNEEPMQTGGKEFPEEPDLVEIRIEQLSPTVQAILSLRMAKSPHAKQGDEARMLVSEINARALGENTSPEVTAEKLLKDEQEK